MKTCPNCEEKIIDANYCTNCGMQLNIIADLLLKGSGRRIEKSRFNLKPSKFPKIIVTNWQPMKSIVYLYTLMALTIIISSSVLSSSHEYIANMIYYAVILGILFKYKKKYKIDLSDIYKFRFGPIKESLISIFIIGITTYITIMLLQLAMNYAGADSIKIPSLIDLDVSFLFNVFIICLLPAVVEEFAFRGLIQTQLHSFLSPRQTIVATAFTFELLHFRFISLPPFVLALVLSYLRYKTKSIWLPMILHFIYNFVLLFYFYETFLS